jgi:LPS O-antigen subunit length determinant protein (WzzB/FepE family)
MKKNNSPLTDDLIDLSYFFNKLWKRKITILIISVLFSFASYFYNGAQLIDKQYQVEVIVKDPPRRMFFFLETLKEINNTEILNGSNFSQDYISAFQSDLLSLDSLQRFVDQNQKIDNFKNFLKLKNINASEYFRNKFGQYKKDQTIIPNKYFMIYNDKLDKPEEFLSDYVKFVQKNNLKELKDQITYQIDAGVYNYEKALEIAKLIELTEPLVKSKNFNQQVLYEPMSLYYNGTKVLSEQIKHLKILKQKIVQEEFAYNPFLDKPSISPFLTQISIQTPTNPRNFAYFGFFLGFFVSVIIIFFRSIFK